MSGITVEDAKHLRRPYTVAAVKFRAGGKPTASGKVRCLTYIDARLAVERVTEIDRDFQSSIYFPAASGGGIGAEANTPIVCALTIKGATREDVGLHACSRVDDMYAKSAASDAFKRAAAQFGVGAYLYSLGDAWVDKDGYQLGSDGKVKWLTREGDVQLRRWYSGKISNRVFVDRFGEPIDYGDRLPEEAEITHFVEALVPEVIAGQQAAVEEQKAAPGPDGEEVFVSTIGELFVLSSKDRTAGIRWAEARKNKNLALKRTVECAATANADRGAVLAALSKNGLEEFISAFDAEVVV